MSDWKKVKLSECCLSIADGDHQPPPKAERGIPFVTISNITSANQFDFSNTLYVPQDYYDRLDEKRKAREGDVLYSVVGSFGIPVFMKENKEFVFQRHIAILRPDSDAIIPQFLFYTMLTRDFYAKADAAALGAAQRTVSLTSLRNIEINIPEKKVQLKIVEILSAFDNLIENNQKQIKLLEEAAQRLYKEWFVDLRFPGYEDVQIVDGVPEGWTKEYLGNCMTIKRGGSPRPIQSYLAEKGLSWLKISDASSSNGFYILDIKEHIKETGLNKTVLLKAGSLVLSNSATPGIPKILDVESCIHDGWLYFENSLFSNEYLLLMFLNERDKLVSLGTGAVFTNLKTDIVKNYPHIVPPKDILNGFQTIVHPVFLKIRENQRTNRLLSEARDRLLPKLMSGEIEL